MTREETHGDRTHDRFMRKRRLVSVSRIGVLRHRRRKYRAFGALAT